MLKTFTINIDPNDNEVVLEAYIPSISPEYEQPDKCRPTILLLPGGGYRMTSDREAQFVALRFAAHAYNVFILRYSVRERACFPKPMIDGFRAIALIRQSAAEWNVDRKRLYVCGFSAGGHLAASLMTMWNETEFQNIIGGSGDFLRPDAGILCYPVIHLPWEGCNAEDLLRMLTGNASASWSALDKYNIINKINADTPPAFLWATATDTTVAASHSLDFASAMLKAGCPVELHMYADGPHGLSLADETTATNAKMNNPRAAEWISLALEWLKNT